MIVFRQGRQGWSEECLGWDDKNVQADSKCKFRIRRDKPDQLIKICSVWSACTTILKQFTIDVSIGEWTQPAMRMLTSRVFHLSVGYFLTQYSTLISMPLIISCSKYQVIKYQDRYQKSDADLCPLEDTVKNSKVAKVMISDRVFVCLFPIQILSHSHSRYGQNLTRVCSKSALVQPTVLYVGVLQKLVIYCM